MKARQSSIYRRLEELRLWSSALVDRLPKSLSFQVEGKAILDDINNALLVTSFALKSPKLSQELLQHISTLEVYLADLDSHITGLRERAKMQKEVNMRSPFLTKDQYATFLKDMTLIGIEVNRWRKANDGSKSPGGQQAPVFGAGTVPD